MIHLEEKIYFLSITIASLLCSILYRGAILESKSGEAICREGYFFALSPRDFLFQTLGEVRLFLPYKFLYHHSLGQSEGGTKLETVKREGVDIVFAIDVSKSMLPRISSPIV